MAKKVKTIQRAHKDLSVAQTKWIIKTEEMHVWRMQEQSLSEAQAINDEMDCFIENYDPERIWTVPESLSMY